MEINMDLKKDFDIRYTPRKKDSKFILFAELQEDYFSVRDENGVSRFGEEILELDVFNPTKYFSKYDAMYYDDFDIMAKDVSWLAKLISYRAPLIFHEIEDLDEWIKNAEGFEGGVKNSLLLLSHPDYKFTYDLIWR
jgi:hypothetical protein